MRHLIEQSGFRWRMAWNAMGIVAVIVVVFGVAALVMPHALRERLYAGEGSVIEWASLVGWVVAAVMVGALLRRVSWGIAGAMVVLLAAAAREADLHKTLTGYSVLKPKFYLKDEFAFSEKLLAAAVVGAVVVGVFFGVRSLLRHAANDGWLRARWVRLIALVVVLGGMSKVIDRAPASLKDLGLGVNETTHEVAKAIEENTECLLPILMVGAAVSFAGRRRGAVAGTIRTAARAA